MVVLQKINLVTVALLSLLAGAAKDLRLPHEVKFFEEAGLNVTMLVLLGAAQLIAGLMLLFHKSRQIGAAIAALCFLISSAIILATGNPTFGFFSLVPVVMASWIVLRNVELHPAWR